MFIFFKNIVASGLTLSRYTAGARAMKDTILLLYSGCEDMNVKKVVVPIEYPMYIIFWWPVTLRTLSIMAGASYLPCSSKLKYRYVI